AVAAGATVADGPMGQIADQFWGDRAGSLVDPHGYHWTIATRKEDLTPEEIRERLDALLKNFAGSAHQEAAQAVSAASSEARNRRTCAICRFSEMNSKAV